MADQAEEIRGVVAKLLSEAISAVRHPGTNQQEVVWGTAERITKYILDTQQGSFNRVLDFHRATGAQIGGGLENEADIHLRVDLIAEEFHELRDALAAYACSSDVGDLLAIADALGDLDYVVNGAAVAFGMPMEAIAREVHRSNMTKLLPNGEALLRDDGKVLKGPNFELPDMFGVLLRAGILQVQEEDNDSDSGEAPDGEGVEGNG